MAEKMTEAQIERVVVKYDPHYPTFGLIDGPTPHKQHPNQRAGLDLYVRVINFNTGETCFKKLYQNGRGLHFKHTGYSPMYLADFTEVGEVVPYQVLTPAGRRALGGTDD